MGARPQWLLSWLLLLDSAAKGGALYWMKAEAGASCTQACPTLCLEDPINYPDSEQEFMYMIKVLGEKCKNIVKGGMRYDPSIDSQSNCGYHLTRTAPQGTKFCGVEPPPGTQRFCPCKGTAIEGTLSLSFQVACPASTPDTQGSSERQCAKAKDTSLAEISSWSHSRRTLCCCTTGHGCIGKDTAFEATDASLVGIALEQAFADGVGLQRRHLSLLPPPEQIDSGVGSPPGTQTLRWRYQIKADDSAYLEKMHCGRVKEALRTVDWTTTYGKSVPAEEVPLSYNVDVNDVDCDDWQCSAWQWSEGGGVRELPPERASWCCGARGLGCGPSHLWILFASVGAFNVIAIIGIMAGHCHRTAPAPHQGYSRMSQENPDTRRE